MIKIYSLTDFVANHRDEIVEVYESFYPEEINSDWLLEDDGDWDKIEEIAINIWYDRMFNRFEQDLEEVRKDVQEFKTKNS